MIDFDDVNEVKEEEPPPAKRGRKDDWTKTSYIKLEKADKELQRMMKSNQEYSMHIKQAASMTLWKQNP